MRVDLETPETTAESHVPTLQLTLVRHGQSDGNIREICQGSSPGYLTELGKAQAHALGLALFSSADSVRYDETWCSDLYRVRETCAIAHEAGNNMDNHASIVYSSLLREKHAGIFDGRPRTEMYAALTKSKQGRYFCPEGGESWNHVQTRVRVFMDMLWKNESGVASLDVGAPRRVLVFTSGGVIKEFINAFVYQRGEDDPEYPNRVGNCSSFVFNMYSLTSRSDMIVENKGVSVSTEQPVSVTTIRKVPSSKKFQVKNGS